MFLIEFSKIKLNYFLLLLLDWNSCFVETYCSVKFLSSSVHYWFYHIIQIWRIWFIAVIVMSERCKSLWHSREWGLVDQIDLHLPSAFMGDFNQEIFTELSWELAARICVRSWPCYGELRVSFPFVLWLRCHFLISSCSSIFPHDRFAPHPYDSGATLGLYIWDQETGERIKRMLLSTLGTLVLLSWEDLLSLEARYLLYVVGLSEETEPCSHPAAPGPTCFCSEKFSWSTSLQVSINISILWTLYWNP